jgi:hypothetical protein
MNSVTTTRDVSIPQKFMNEQKLNDTLNLSKDIEIIKTSPGVIDNSIINGIKDFDLIFTNKNEKQKLNFSFSNYNKRILDTDQNNINVIKDIDINVSFVNSNKNVLINKYNCQKSLGYIVVVIVFIIVLISIGMLFYNIFFKQ